MGQAVTQVLHTSPRTQWFWQDAICQVWASQSGKHWQHSHGVERGIFRQLLYYTIVKICL